MFFCQPSIFNERPNMAEVIGWILAVAICIVLPVALGYYDAVAGRAAGLAVLAWLLRTGGIDDDTRTGG